MKALDGEVALLSVPDAAREFGIKYNTLISRIKSKTLPATLVGKHRYVHPEDILRFEEYAHAKRHGPNWDAVAKCHAEGLPDIRISERLGISRERVRQLRVCQRLEPNPRRPRLPKYEGTY